MSHQSCTHPSVLFICLHLLTVLGVRVTQHNMNDQIAIILINLRLVIRLLWRCNLEVYCWCVSCELFTGYAMLIHILETYVQGNWTIRNNAMVSRHESSWHVFLCEHHQVGGWWLFVLFFTTFYFLLQSMYFGISPISTQQVCSQLHLTSQMELGMTVGLYLIIQKM